MNNAAIIPLRKDVAKSDQWDLSKLFPNESAWEVAWKEYAAAVDAIPQWKGVVGISAEKCADCLAFFTSLEMQDERLAYYAHLRTTEDVGNSAAQERFSRYFMLASKAKALSSYLIPEILSLPEAKIQYYLQAEILKDQHIALHKILRFKQYTLSEAEERILALQEESGSTAEKAFSALTNVDLDFGTIDTPEGTKPLTLSTYSTFMESKDRNIRRAAYERFVSVMDKNSHILSALFEGSVQQDLFKARARGYSSALQMSLYKDDIPEDVYNNLIKTIDANLSLLHNYYDLRRIRLGLDKLCLFDTKVSLTDEVKICYPYEEAVQTVVQALSPLGTEYCSILKKGLLSGWVDRYENKGKRSGAFSAGSYYGDPYILLNYKKESLRDVFTLAHEAGHSMHSYYSIQSNPFQHYNYTIFEAEVASTFNEQLLAHYLLQNTADKKVKLFIIGKLIDDIIATIFRQTMFAEFEKITHTMLEEGKPLSLDSTRIAYRALLEKYFGPSVHLDEHSDLEGLRIPHFYHAFYVYKYATGLSAAIALSRKVLNGSQSECNAYHAFLCSGGSRFPLESLKLAGVDMRKPEPIEDAIKVFAQLLQEFQKQFD